MILSLLGLTVGCGQKTDAPTQDKPVQVDSSKAVEKKAEKEINMELQSKADEFLKAYLGEYALLFKKQALAYWTAANSGKKEDFDTYAAADLEFKQLHSDQARYAELLTFTAAKASLQPHTARALEVAELAFKGNQLPKDILEKRVAMSAQIEEIFNNFRGEVDGKKYSNNDLLDMIKIEKDSLKRQKMWEALKQVGDAIAPKLIELAKIRNEAATKLGYKNYWDMQVRLQEHDPDKIITIFAELEKDTLEPFKQMKVTMDTQLAKQFGIKSEEMMPWHYDNPFFQDPPPSEDVNLDEFYEKKKKEDIVELARKFYENIGLPIDDIIAASDLYEREGKQQHAFCISIDNEGDVRTLVNIKPTYSWMETMLHEMGHGVYTKYTDTTLPFNIRDAAHIFTTEAVAMLMGALALNPTWMTTYAGADVQRVKEVEKAVLEQRRSQQLIFARWTLVMLNFEKAMYEDPTQDLNTLWWDMVERFQLLTRPLNRNAADWAAKPHFTIAPVYYHNYMLGELFAAQLRNTLKKLAKHDGPAYTMDYSKHPEFGTYLKEKIFLPSASTPWPQFVENAVGEPLTAKYFAEELK